MATVYRYPYRPVDDDDYNDASHVTEPRRPQSWGRCAGRGGAACSAWVLRISIDRRRSLVPIAEQTAGFEFNRAVDERPRLGTILPTGSSQRHRGRPPRLQPNARV